MIPTSRLSATAGKRVLFSPVEAPGRLLPGVLDDSHVWLGYAAELMASVEDEIGDLRRDTIPAGDLRLSERLAELSRALRWAALMLDQQPVIGLCDSLSSTSPGFDPEPVA